MKGHWILYTAKELAWIKSHRVMPRRQAHAQFCKKFSRQDVSFQNFKAVCLRNGVLTGRAGHFEKGMIPHNRGKKMLYNANSAKHQFKPGQAPHNTQYLHHERLSLDGYVEISVAETNPHTGFWRRYRFKHRYLWEQQHGPVPASHVLKCLDGNRLNCDPSNWIAIPRSLMPFLNGHRGLSYDQASPDLKPVILTLAKLKHARFAKVRPARVEVQ